MRKKRPSTILILISSLAASAVALLLCGPSSAQEDETTAAPSAETDDDAQAEAITEPRLLHEVPLAIPEAAQGLEISGDCILLLTIDAEGAVTAVEVRAGLGHGLDEAAEAAARQFRFEPATQRGKAVASRILFQIPVHLPELGATDEETSSPLDDLESESSPRAEEEPKITVQPVLESPMRPAEAAIASPPEIIVRGRSTAEETARSPAAVEVVDLSRDKQGSQDMGEVLSRMGGVNVQRAGGLGSNTRFDLAGLGGDRVRFFLDGVPLAFVGFPFGVSNVPTNLVDRVEIYQGVVPVRFGADALGGAVNLVSDQSLRRTKAAGSLQMGSFNTFRGTANAQAFDEASGWTGRLAVYMDSSQNNYPVSVEVTETNGELTPARVPLFHSAYQAGGGTATVGLVDHDWLKELLLSGFFTANQSEVQSDLTMTVPYGDVEFEKQGRGANLRARLRPVETVTVDFVGGTSRVTTNFLDVGSCRMGWRGDCLVDLTPIRGEVNQIPVDREVVDHAFFARAHAEWNVLQDHDLRLSIAPTWIQRKGQDEELDAEAGEHDPLTLPQELDSIVAGAEWEVEAFSERFGNILFAKFYTQSLRAQQLTGENELTDTSRVTNRVGAGDSARHFFLHDLYVKGSYELATRQPSMDEVFGDGRLLINNLSLLPESSHNFNVGLYEDDLPVGPIELFGAAAGFGRWVKDAIEEVPSATFSQFVNIDSLRALGATGRLGVRDARARIQVEGRFSFQDLRNTSQSGAWAAYHGDTVPNHPSLRAAAHVLYRVTGIVTATDMVEFSWWTRYVHEFFRGWESLGDEDLKQVIPSQLTHSLAIAHVLSGQTRSLSHTLEAQNLTNADVYDFYGMQRPGRSFHYKLTFEI
jgi:vitamin B12 transporter